ncbi:hypothetical protein Aduo_003908 [Ancylostoma duodenale]
MDPDCNKKIDEGECDAYFPRYAYDSSKGGCVRFIFGGCDGNENNFETRAECERKCMRGRVGGKVTKPRAKIMTDPMSGKENTDSDCTLPIKSGPCLAYMPRYGYDAKREECVKFIYGGCGGNGNNFATQAECESICLG